MEIAILVCSYCVVSDESGMDGEKNASFTGQGRRENCAKEKKKRKQKVKSKKKKKAAVFVCSERCGW